jgi:hypothetical protein
LLHCACILIAKNRAIRGIKIIEFDEREKGGRLNAERRTLNGRVAVPVAAVDEDGGASYMNNRAFENECLV